MSGRTQSNDPCGGSVKATCPQQGGGGAACQDYQEGDDFRRDLGFSGQFKIGFTRLENFPAIRQGGSLSFLLRKCVGLSCRQLGEFCCKRWMNVLDLLNFNRFERRYNIRFDIQLFQL